MADSPQQQQQQRHSFDGFLFDLDGTVVDSSVAVRRFWEGCVFFVLCFFLFFFLEFLIFDCLTWHLSLVIHAALKNEKADGGEEEDE